MTQVKSPFLIVNVKSYLYNEELLKLARAADEWKGPCSPAFT